MARLYLFAEGQTEVAFADLLLKSHLANLGVYLHPPVLIAHARRHGIIHRGGGRRYLPMRNDILRFLRQERSADVFFTTLIDLYGLHTDFPGLEKSSTRSPGERVTALEENFARDIGDPRFVPHLQLHEFEAYLFTDPQWFAMFYENSHRQIDALRQIASGCASPELIDDGPQTAPSKRIISHLPDYAGAKAAIGPQIASLIGLSAIRTACPHFAAWLSRLESLGNITLASS